MEEADSAETEYASRSDEEHKEDPMARWLVTLIASFAMAGCGTMFKGIGIGSQAPLSPAPSAGEVESGYTYIPVDPFPVETVDGDSCKTAGAKPPKPSGDKKAPESQTVKLLDALPDNAVRMLVEKFDVSGNVTYGASKTGANGEFYRVTVDYINADTINFSVWVLKRMRVRTTGELVPVDLFGAPDPRLEPGSETYEVSRDRPTSGNKFEDERRAEFNIPVYVGVGLRVSANVYVIGANANISGIGVIGAEAEADRLRGSLIVQTLGVNGKSVAAALPIQSELNRTTAQNAIVAVGSIKALLYSDETVKSPRVVGLYLPFPGGKPLVNALISELSKKRVPWTRPCAIAS